MKDKTINFIMEGAKTAFGLALIFGSAVVLYWAIDVLYHALPK